MRNWSVGRGGGGGEVELGWQVASGHGTGHEAAHLCSPVIAAILWLS